MSKESDKMKKDTRTKPGWVGERTRNTLPREKLNNTKTGQTANTRQNTTNKGYQQDR